MRLVSCKCPNCGANVKLNEQLEKGMCNFCGAEVINQDVIKINVDGEVIVSNINLKKEIETAKKLFEAHESADAIAKLNYVLENDLFNYDALSLYLNYVFSTYSKEELNKNSNFINKTINKFEAIKKEDDNLKIKEYRSALENVQKKYKQKVGLAIIAGFGTCCFLFLLIVLNGLNQIPTYSIAILLDTKKITVGEQLKVKATIEKDHKIVNDEEIIWYENKNNAYNDNGSITADGVITAEKVGNYTFCAKLASDNQISTCKMVTISEVCKNSYTFKASFNDWNGSYTTINKTAGIDFCPGTYVIHIDSVEDPEMMYSISTPRTAYYYIQNNDVTVSTQNTEVIFVDNSYIKTSDGIISITLYKK